MNFEASQTVAGTQTGFVWDARVQAAPLLAIRVRDAFVKGEGSGQVAILGAFVVGRQAGGVEMNSGSLNRYLAEAVWYPTALLPSDHLRWGAVSDSVAIATLTDGDITVSLEFRFAETGEVSSIYTPQRWGTFEGGFRQVAWEGHFANYARRGEFLVPTEGDVGWYSPDGTWEPVWKGRLIEAEFELLP